MAWDKEHHSWGSRGVSHEEPISPFSISEQCFIRKEHKCGKIFGASKSCFIACPSNDDLQPILELMSEKLMKVGIEPIIAVKERAYGQDIFCTKICGKIIEARFCIVILDDTVDKNQNIPNPNVYYEYGLMTSLRKHVIPLQKEDLRLAFNIQSYDTIKYNAKNISSELDRAFKDAIRITEAGGSNDQELNQGLIPSKSLKNKLEILGFEIRSSGWYLNDVISDTDFKGFGHKSGGFYAYIGRIDDRKEFVTYLEDTDVVLYRTEKKFKEVEQKLLLLNQQIEGLETKPISASDKERMITTIGTYKSIISSMNNMYIAFVVHPQLDSTDFSKRIKKILSQYKRYQLAISTKNEITIGNIIVPLELASS